MVTEKDIINRAKKIYVLNYPLDMHTCVVKAINELDTGEYLRRMYSNYDITLDDYVDSICKKLQRC